MKWADFAKLVMASRYRAADRPEVAEAQELVDRAVWSRDGGRWVTGPSAGAKMSETKGDDRCAHQGG